MNSGFLIINSLVCEGSIYRQSDTVLYFYLFLPSLSLPPSYHALTLFFPFEKHAYSSPFYILPNLIFFLTRLRLSNYP